jgi:hypothetical protein
VCCCKGYRELATGRTAGDWLVGESDDKSFEAVLYGARLVKVAVLWGYFLRFCGNERLDTVITCRSIHDEARMGIPMVDSARNARFGELSSILRWLDRSGSIG